MGFSSTSASPGRGRRVWLWIVAALALAGALGVVLALLSSRFRPVPPQLVDLRPHYNFALTNCVANHNWKRGLNHLGAFPRGTNEFSGVPFFVEGMVQLRCIPKNMMRGPMEMPERVDGIAIGRKARELHILHGVGGSSSGQPAVGFLELHYDNGQSAKLPIVFRRHVRDWWWNKESTDPMAEGTSIAWRGDNEDAKAKNCHLRIYKSTFANPNPDWSVRSLDFVSTLSPCSPFLLGLTVQ